MLCKKTHVTMKVITLADRPAVNTFLSFLKYGFALNAKRMHMRAETQRSAANQNTMPMRPSKPSIPAAMPMKIVVSSLASVNAFRLRETITGFCRLKNLSSISLSFSFYSTRLNSECFWPIGTSLCPIRSSICRMADDLPLTACPVVEFFLGGITLFLDLFLLLFININ